MAECLPAYKMGQKKSSCRIYFSDRIEIISTGGLPVDLNKEEFFKGISKPVNIKLQKIFGQLGYVEQAGHGVPLIISNYGKTAFEIMENYINVTIPFHYSKNIGSDHINTMKFNEAEKNLIKVLKEKPEITIRELVSITKYSNSYIRKLLSSLKEKKAITRLGSKKSGSWCVHI